MSLLNRVISILVWRPRFFATRGQPRPSRRIHIFSRGLDLIDLRAKKCLWNLDWADVREIIVYKADMITYDDIRIVFRTDGLEYFAVSEMDENFNDLCDFLQNGFGIDWPRCYAHVVQPPFAANRTTIWGTPWPLPCPNCNYDLRASSRICPECGRPVDPPSLLPADAP